MLELRDRAGLAAKTFLAVRVRGQRSRDRLKRDESVETDLARKVNYRHSATTEDIDQLVIVDSRADLPPFGQFCYGVRRSALGPFIPRPSAFQHAAWADLSEERPMQARPAPGADGGSFGSHQSKTQEAQTSRSP